MNRRERRAMDRMTKKEFQKVRDYTLKQLKLQYPNQNFTLEEITQAEDKVRNIIENEKQFK